MFKATVALDGLLASSNPSRMEPKDQKVCMLVHKLSYWNAQLKVPKCENFHPFNYGHFYSQSHVVIVFTVASWMIFRLHYSKRAN